MSAPADVAVIGGGIVGCAAAAFLAEAGAKVEVYERELVASAASGRNSGVVQHPFDQVLAPLHRETLEHLRGLEGLELPAEPAGIMMVARERAPLEPVAAQLAHDAPELAPRVLAPAEVEEREPALARGTWACLLETGYPVEPAAATRALARRAYAAGARFFESETAWPWVTGGRARGVLAAGVRRAAGAVLVAAGPWTPELVDPTRAWQPIVPVWGVVAEVELGEPPRHVVEEAGVEAVVSGGPSSIFSLVAAGGRCAVGSTFLAQSPDADAWAPGLVRAGERFVPGLAGARLAGARACARPQSLDGRPLLGELPGQVGLWVAAGHGPWGISTGAATGRMVAAALRGEDSIPAALAAGRLQPAA